jgi:glycerate kinase
MRILIAPDKFKESLSASAAAAAMARGATAACPGAQVDLCPVSDGGEGLVEALVQATGGTRRLSRVAGPLGEPVEAGWGVLGDGHTAVIEMAQASGLALVPPDRRDPRRTTTFGVGELIRFALDSGLNRFILGIGGSATNDGGTGMAQALGGVFPGTQGLMTGGQLQAIQAVDLSRIDPRIKEAAFTVACDVTNPLTGPRGASVVYGPQKGASPPVVAELDRGLGHLAGLLRGVDPAAPGAGAAGGLGFGAMAFLGARLLPGADLVLDAVGFDRRVAHSQLVITGEGRMDAQSLSGKLCVAAARRAARLGVPAIACVGLLEEAAELRRLFRSIHAIVELCPDRVQAMRQAARWLEALAERAVRTAVGSGRGA